MPPKIVSWKGKKYLFLPETRLYYGPLPNKITKRGKRVVDEIIQEASKALLDFWVKRGEK